MDVVVGLAKSDCEHDFVKNIEGEPIEKLIGPQVIYDSDPIFGLPRFYLIQGTMKRCAKCKKGVLHLSKWEQLELEDQEVESEW